MEVLEFLEVLETALESNVPEQVEQLNSMDLHRRCREQPNRPSMVGCLYPVEELQ
jgi:hypothetical protein